MAMNEADQQYQSTPADAQYEHTDVEPSIIRNFAIWLGVSMMISAAIVYGTFWFFEGRQRAADAASQRFPLAVGQVKEPLSPRLQTQPFKDVYTLRQGEQDKLTTYGWVDRGQGVVRLPIDRAMALTLERGLPVRSGPAATTAPDRVVEDSSAGRTTAAR